MDKKLSTEEATDLIESMMDNPAKYGLTEEFFRQWSQESISEAASILDKIPGNLRDELSDGIIRAYKERKKNDREV